MAKRQRKSATKRPAATARKYVSQTEFPQISLERALRISQALWDNFAGGSAEPHQVALALDLAPTSGGWRNLCGSSIAYGLTEGGYGADEIEMTQLGRRVIAPLEEGDDRLAMVEAILAPRIMREFYTKYDKAKFPRNDVAKNLLVSFGLPKSRADTALQILKDNAEFTGVAHETKTGTFIALGNPVVKAVIESADVDAVESTDELVVVPASSVPVPSATPAEPGPRRHTETAVAEYISPSAPLRRGLDVDIYRLKERLGAGYSAEVWSATVRKVPPGVDLEKNAQVAMKIYHSYAMALPDQVVRVEREFRIAQRIRHPHLVRIYEFMLASPRPHHCFLVMDLAKGQLLKDHVASKNLSAAQNVVILRHMASALDEMHTAGAIHRDVKPSNISVEVSGTQVHATLLDLGIVSITYEKNVTAGSRFMGSKHWAPYEQLLGQPLDERSDIYSLGAVAYNLFTGFEPFSGSPTEAAIAVQMSNRPLEIPLLADVPRDVIDVMNQALSSKPENRPRTVREILTVLDRNTT